MEAIRTHDDDPDGMRSLLAAAVGLAGLGSLASSFSQKKEQGADFAAAPAPAATGADASPSAVPSRPDPPTSKKPQTQTVKRALPAARTKAAPSAAPVAVTSRPAAASKEAPRPNPSTQRDESRVVGGATGAAAGASSSYRPKKAQAPEPQPSYFATTVVHRPTPYPDQQESSSSSSPRSQQRLSPGSSTAHQGEGSALPPKRQKVNQRTWTMPSEQLQAQASGPSDKKSQQEQGSPDPTADAAATSIDDAAAANPAAAADDAAGMTLNFPEILFEIISDPANRHILSWLPHGRGFAIHDKHLFASEILPAHFDGTKYTSFTRRLKRWNFERVPRGPEMGAYYNKNFVRGRPDLVRSMVYGMEDGEQPPQTAEGEAKDSSSDNDNNDSNDDKKEERREQEQEREREQENENKKEEKDIVSMVASKKAKQAAHDDAVVASAMEVHRQKLKLEQRLKRDMAEEKIMEDVKRHEEMMRNEAKKNANKNAKTNKKPSEMISNMGESYDDAVVEAAMEAHRQQLKRLKMQHQQLSRESEGFYQEMAWRHQMEEEKQQAPFPPPRQVTSSPGKKLPLPVQFRPGEYSSHMAELARLNELQKEHQQQKVKKLSQQISPKGPASPGRSPRRPPFQKPPNGAMHPTPPVPPGYPRPTAKSRKRKQSNNEPVAPQPQRGVPQPPLPPPGRYRSYPEELELQQLHAMRNAEADPEEYLTMPRAHRNMLAQHRRIPGALASLDRNEYLISMMEMERRNHEGVPSSAVAAAALDRSAFLSQRRHPDSISPPMDIERRQCLNDIERQILLEEMSSSSYPHHAAPSSAGPLSGSGYARSHLDHRMNYHGEMRNGAVMAEREAMLEAGGASAFMDAHHPPSMTGRHRTPLANDEMSRKILASSKTHKEIMMMAARDLQSRAEAREFVAGAPSGPPPFPRQPHHPSRHLRDDLPVQQPRGHQRPMPPPRHVTVMPRMGLPPSSRAGYLASHAMMLRELEEEVFEKEKLAAEAAGAAVPAPGYYDEGEYGQMMNPAKSRNGRASAA